ncbi:MAG: 2-hydroxyacyl-CoA dehydratase family protein [Prevotellaceae bacterium]|nr:2-hydroxyacyl-CoA dehydratase family protein [Prevotellaceae bacterium]
MKKKNFLFTKRAITFMAAGMILFASCGKDDNKEKGDDGSNVLPDNTIVAQVEDGNSYNEKIDTIVARIFNEDTPCDLAKAAYKNGGFTLKLPATVDDKYLVADFKRFTDGVKVSDPNAKLCQFEVLRVFKSGEELQGRFFHIYSSEKTKTMVEYIYTDRDLSVTGGYTEEREIYIGNGNFEKVIYDNTFNVNLKKGWNITYLTQTETATGVTQTITSKAPENVKVKWVYDGQ